MKSSTNRSSKVNRLDKPYPQNHITRAHECTFCRIIARNLPGYIVYEDVSSIVFLPMRPINQGHVLVASRSHYDSYMDVPDDIAANMTQTARDIARLINIAFTPKRVGFSVVGFEVLHAHIHVIPLYNKHEMTSSVYANSNGHDIEWTDEGIPVCSAEEQAEIVAKLVQAI